MSDINWDEAPDWANCSLKNKKTGIVQFANKTSNGYFRANENCSQFIMGDNAWSVIENRPTNEHKALPQKKSGSKYIITMKNKLGESIDVDAYDIITACNITCPAHAHAAKKVLYTGLRGHKDKATDLRESIDALERAIELATKS